MKELIQNLSQSFENKESRKTQRELIHQLELLIKNFIPNEKFAINEFDEHIEKTINQAKTELSNYLARYIANSEVKLPMAEQLLSIGDKK